MQKTKFATEILIHDDASTDGTAEALRSYQRMYPDKIKCFYEKKNQYSRGNLAFIDSLFRDSQGDYLAVCEGDDFWTDPNKLQLQVEFLEKNKDYAVCFHPVRVFFEKGEQPDSIFPEETSGFTLKRLLQRNFIQTNSVVYRRQDYEKLKSGAVPNDWYLHLYHARFGKIGFINRVMGAYRRHSGGLWWSGSYKNRAKFWQTHLKSHLVFYEEMYNMFGASSVYSRQVANMVASNLDHFWEVCGQDGQKLLAAAIPSAPNVISLYISKKAKEEEGQRALEEELRQDLGALREEIKDIKSSRSWRLAQALSKLKRAVIK